MTRVAYSLVFYFLLMALLWVAKPAWLFTSEGEFRQFGTDGDESVFSIGVVATTLAALCYYTFAMIDCLASRSA